MCFTLCFVATNLSTANSDLNSLNDLIEMIKKGKFSFASDEWSNVSVDAKNLIRKLLVVDPSKRLVPCAALKHRWLDETPLCLKGIKPNKSSLKVQLNLQKNKRRLTKSNINLDVNKRISFNLDIKHALESYEVLLKNKTKNSIISESSDSNPASIEEMLED